ncbi:MAG: hypothetical protein M1823_004185 [Watsoniomyces obsoletus]|nr:MAG: hypothetical protein M1823_004185 [Watsoniomyces obsoletus]
MPTARLFVVLTSLVCFLVLFCGLSAVFSVGQHAGPHPPTSPRHGGLRAHFAFSSPSALFPPSAIVSLTDDNSTFFLARPAAFGPLLPEDGLSGQLWVGSDFGDDEPVPGGGESVVAEGELGCSDIPGWDDQREERRKAWDKDTASKRKRPTREKSEQGRGDAHAGDASQQRPAEDKKEQAQHVDANVKPAPEDGTDDYLHRSMPESCVKEPSKAPHADIQSLQESAEIAGKVVLLSRGGCGFFEKVMWVQRRGGVALIVGDNKGGRSLVTMYAQGDTSNVSIPALFTSHMTAHVLSSLMPAERSRGHHSSPDKKGGKSKSNRNKESSRDRPTFTPAADAASATATGRTRNPAKINTRRRSVKRQMSEKSFVRDFFSVFQYHRKGGSASEVEEDSRRPPSSGQLDWDSVGHGKKIDHTTSTTAPSSTPTKPASAEPKADPASGDDFVIGVQDWRDPDLVGHQALNDQSTTTVGTVSASSTRAGGARASAFAKAAQGGSSSAGSRPADNQDGRSNGRIITPGSGEYGSDSSTSGAGHDGYDRAASDSESPPTKGWLGGLSWHDADDKQHDEQRDHSSPTKPSRHGTHSQPDQDESLDEPDGTPAHEGLWVTLTPTTVSTSPFFDTLLVLVVSPLVTLTVVYAMLLLRSRIRRRRWRAPKSVVERLPVRTYHTVPSSSNLAALQFSTPNSASPDTPLLHPAAMVPTRPKVRSQTTTDARAPMARSWPPGAHEPSVVPDSTAMHHPPTAAPAAAPPNVSRRYRGRQVECVVCLEEYVDGVSRVMSLPCGHEFHAECITPWLTTRRRTCPICKGDVVRSLASQSADSGTPYHDEPDVEPDVTPSAVPPSSRSTEESHADLERAEPTSDEDTTSSTRPVNSRA